tara:strand:- start:288 stop:665 length:378 start_codon:yes stop_codon:yes gene_type:complete
MKAAEFKKLIKPLIKESVKELLFEEGILSGLISEVAKGLQSNIVVEARTPAPPTDQRAQEEKLEKEKQEKIKRLNESAKYDAFAGTKVPREQSQGPLSGVSPADSGVDITAIQQIANGKWKRLIG